MVLNCQILALSIIISVDGLKLSDSCTVNHNISVCSKTVILALSIITSVDGLKLSDSCTVNHNISGWSKTVRFVDCQS